MDSSHQPSCVARRLHSMKRNAAQHHGVHVASGHPHSLQQTTGSLTMSPGSHSAGRSAAVEAEQDNSAAGPGSEQLMTIIARRKHQDPHHSGTPHSTAGSSSTSSQIAASRAAPACMLPGIPNTAQRSDHSGALPAKATALPDLATCQDIPDEAMRALFQEVQQLSTHSSVAAGLQLTEDKLRALYAHCSHRLDSLPYALVAHSNEQLRMVALPGPRGVLGYKVNENGQVLRSKQRAVGPYLAASASAPVLLKELQDLESDMCANPQGLECEPELVALWTQLGGNPNRHKQLRQTSRQTSFTSQTGKKDGLSLMNLGLLTCGSQHASPAVSPKRGPQRRRSGRLQGRPVVNVNTLTGSHLGFYSGYVKNIQELTHPEALGPIIQVMFEQQQAEQERQRLRAQRAMFAAASPDIESQDGQEAQHGDTGREVQSMAGGRLEEESIAMEASQTAASTAAEPVDWDNWDMESVGSTDRSSMYGGLSQLASQPVSQQMTPRTVVVDMMAGCGMPVTSAGSAQPGKHSGGAMVKPQSAVAMEAMIACATATHPGSHAGRAGSVDSGKASAAPPCTLEEPKAGVNPTPDPTASLEGCAGSQEQMQLSSIRLDLLQNEAEEAVPKSQVFSLHATQQADRSLNDYEFDALPGLAGAVNASQNGPDAEHMASEAALHLMQDALQGPGRRTKMRRREPWSVMTQQQQTEQAIAKARTHSIRSHKSRRITESTDVGSTRAGSQPGNHRDHLGSKSFKSFKSHVSRVSRVSYSAAGGMEEDDDGLGAVVVCCEEVEKLMDGWEMGRDGGDGLQVMSVDRMKELMLVETQDEAPRDVVGIAAAQLGVKHDPSTWEGHLAKWLPNKEEQAAAARSRSTPAKHVHQQPRPPHVAPTWVPQGLRQRAQTPGSKLQLPGPPAVAPTISTARHAYKQAAQGQLGFGVKVSASAQALQRRLEQQHAHEQQPEVHCEVTHAPAQANFSIPTEWGCELDLAMAPHLARADLGLVFQALRGAPHITTLRANRGLLDSSGVRGLLHVLRSVHTLQVLDVRDTPAFGAEAAERVGELLQPRHKLMLQTLLLSGCPVKDEGFHSLALGLQFNRTLAHLNLSHCGLKDNALLALDQVLEQNVALGHLDLSHNSFGCKGIQRLCADLEGNAGLHHLVLSHCKLDDRCAEALAELLPCSAALQVLDLSHNSIGPAGAAHLGTALSLLESQACTLGVRSLSHTPSELNQPTSGQQAHALATSGMPFAPQATHNAPMAAASASDNTPSSTGNHVQLPTGVLRPPVAGDELSDTGVPPEPTMEASHASSNAPFPRPAQPSCCPFQCLLLHSNPLGLEGIMYIFKGIQQLGQDSATSCQLQRVGLDNTHLPHKLTAIIRAAADTSDMATQQSVLGAAATQLPWDPDKPSGTHLLNLASSHGKQVADVLVGKARSGHVRWLSAKLDEQVLLTQHLPPASWCSAMPSTGILQVTVVQTSSVADTVPCMSAVLERVLITLLHSPASSEPVKEQLITCMCHVAAVTAAQAARLVSCLEYNSTKVAAAAQLLTCCVNSHEYVPTLLLPVPGTAAAEHSIDHATGGCMSANLSSALRPHSTQHSLMGGCSTPGRARKAMGLCPPALTPDEVTHLMNTQTAQAWRYTPGAGSLLSSISHWLHIACPGHYVLDLSQQVQRLVACCAVAIAGQQQKPCTPITYPLASLLTTPLGDTRSVGRNAAAAAKDQHAYSWQLLVHTWDQPVHLGLLGSMLRNVQYQGKAVDNLPTSVQPSRLPHSGLLEFDLVLAHQLSLEPLPRPPSPLPLPPPRSLTVPPKPKAQPNPESVSVSASTVLHAGTVHASLASPGSMGMGTSVFGHPASPGTDGGVSYSRFATRPDSVPGYQFASGSVAAGSAAMLLRASAPAHVARTLLKTASNNRVARARQARAAQGEAWWQMFTTCMSLMGLSAEDLRLQGCKDAASCWGGLQYDASLVRWRARAIARHCGQIEAETPDEVPDAGDVAAAGSAAKKSGKQGKASSSSSSKAAKEAARAAANAAQERAVRQEKAMQGARKCLPIMLQHTLTHKLTAVQVLHMLALLPDVAARMALLATARPALLDPHHMLDLVISLAGPTPLPSPKVGQQRLASAGSRLGPGTPESPSALHTTPSTSDRSHRPSSTGLDKSSLGPGSPKAQHHSSTASPSGSQLRPNSWLKAGGDSHSGRSFRFQGSFAAHGSFRFQASFAAGRSFFTPPSMSRGRSLRFQDSIASAFGGEGGEFLLDELDRPAEYMQPVLGNVSSLLSQAVPCAAGHSSTHAAPRLNAGATLVAPPKAASSDQVNSKAASKASAKPATAAIADAPASQGQPSQGSIQGASTLTSKPVMDIAAMLALAMRHLGLDALQLQWADPSTLDLVMQALAQPSSSLGQPSETSTDAGHAIADDVPHGPQEAGLLLNMTQAEHVQAAMRLCRWLDMANPATPLDEVQPMEGAWTDAGYLPMEQHSSWAQWEQLLGWLCARAMAGKSVALGAPPPALDFNRPTQALLSTHSSLNRPSRSYSCVLTRTLTRRSSNLAGMAHAALTAVAKTMSTLGKLRLSWSISDTHRTHAAATLIQSVWRGNRLRRCVAAAIRTEVQQGSSFLGKRKQGLDAHLLATHLPMACLPDRARDLLIMAEDSDDASSEPASEPEVEYVQPLRPLYQVAVQPGRTDAVESAAKQAAVDATGSRPLIVQRQTTMQGRLTVGFKSELRASFPKGADQLGVELHGIPSKGEAQTQEHQVWARAVRRWHSAWAMIKYWHCVDALQQLGGPLSLAHARLEMAANADHLFPLAGVDHPPVPALTAVSEERL